MNWKMTIALVALGSVGLLAALTLEERRNEAADRAKEARLRALPLLEPCLRGIGARKGDEVYLRILKEERQLELWMRPEGHPRFSLLKTYPVAAMSGELGPKTAEGDMQAPEGFYAVEKHALNPRSSFHLSFNIGYPNAHDRSLGRTGSFIMVHGGDCSIGCFAMTDAGIEEIYTLVAAALGAGQNRVPVEIYPFRMTEDNMRRHAASPHMPVWEKLKRSWQYSEEQGLPALHAER